jgi:predicted PhzF superfamily epimerase YddE/YHI9
MNFPAVQSQKIDIPEELSEALKVKPAELYKSDDYMAVFNDEKTIVDLEPDFELLKKLDVRGTIVTAPSDKVDFVSRFFAPGIGVKEDPVTGSTHTKLVPYWSKRLGKTSLNAEQLSQRGGKVSCTDLGDRVELKGNARTYLIGEITTK